MFFSSHILTKKGPLAKVWLAAHWEKKLTKQEVQVIDLSQYVLLIREPKVKISCRTQGELLLGCARIYACKVSHLLKESSQTTITPEVVTVVTETEDRDVKEKRVTMASGLQDLVAIQEIASFDVNEVFATSVNDLPMAEGFNVDEWWGKAAELPTHVGGQAESDGNSPVQQPVRGPSEAEWPKTPIYVGTDHSSAGVDIQSRDFDMTTIEPELHPHTPQLGVTTPVPEQPQPQPRKEKRLPVFDPATTLDPSTVKQWLTKKDTTKNVVLLPSTEEELLLLQEKRFALDDLLLRPDPPKRRRIDPTGLPSTRMLPVVEQPEDVEQPRTMFEEIVWNGLRSIEERGDDPHPFPTPSRATPSNSAGAGVSAGDYMTPDLQPPPGPLDSPTLQPISYGGALEVEAPTADETLHDLQKQLKPSRPLPFSELAQPGQATRRDAALKFMDLLVLASKDRVTLQQDKPFAEINVQRGTHFNQSLDFAA